MADELVTILRLVADGTLSPDEAAPIIDAISRTKGTPRPDEALGAAGAPLKGRRVRILVSEKGRRVVDLSIPLGLASMAARIVPGIPQHYASLITEAVESNKPGTIVDVEDESGDGVLISLE